MLGKETESKGAQVQGASFWSYSCNDSCFSYYDAMCLKPLVRIYRIVCGLCFGNVICCYILPLAI
jgi:hypothetical protein